MNVVTLSVLGRYDVYSEVFYRVYTPPGRSSGVSRKAIVVATNFGPLAITAANLYNEFKEKGTPSSSDNSFFLGLLIPITLVMNTGFRDTDELESLLSNPRDIALRIAESLIEKINKGKTSIKEFIEEEKLSSVKNVLLTYIECDLKTNAVSANDVDWVLPAIEPPRKCVLSIDVIGNNSKSNSVTFNGALGIGVVPLTGSFKLGDGSKKSASSSKQSEKSTLVLFREATKNVVGVYGELMLATYLQAVKTLICEAATEEGLRTEGAGNDSGGGDEVLLLVDTTHGLNSATTTMFHAVMKSLPLIHYEFLRNRVRKLKTLFYNSDPAIGLGNAPDSLKNTLSNNISYYYIDRHPQSLRLILEEVENLVLNEVNDTSYHKVLRGLYLLNRGLIPWGLYEIETAGELDRDENRALLVYEVSSDSGTVNVKYRFEARSDAKLAPLHVLGFWLAQLAKEGVRNLSESISLEGAFATWCWDGIVDESQVRCYDVNKLKEIISRERGSPGWGELMVNEIVGDVARLVFEYEVDEWREDPFRRLLYQVPKAFTLKDEICKEEYSKIVGEPRIPANSKGNEGEALFCLTPMKAQKEARNIVAHAGLTAVHRGVAFILAGKDKCGLKGVCIAKSFPIDKLRGR